MANTDRTRKLLVRTALVTSTTIATVVGAQNIAMLDALQLQATPPAQDIPLQVLDTPADTAAVLQAAPQLSIVRAAPSIIILRQAGQVQAPQAAASSSTTAVIQPPVPAQLAPPAPIIVQQQAPAPQQQVAVAPAPAVQQSRSTR
ncbi:MAG: hypothetical protein IPM16_23660 [Chloroflexi bacterium]|nr:hypothetical protein [Chloroflexota bacterium]